jgi:hydrogenase/urease accessory protein HupE
LKAIVIASAILFALIMPVAASAHEVRPTLLDIKQQSNGRYKIAWKRPVVGDVALRLVPHISGHLLDRSPDTIDVTNSYDLYVWHNVDAGKNGLEGRQIWVDGLDSSITDAMISIQPADGETLNLLLTPSHPRLTVRTHGAGLAVPAYLLLGVEHILTGFDHLSFVLGLVLLVRTVSMLVKTITAFTLAHSVTLALTALRIITVRPNLVEVLVALSIVFVSVELVHKQQGRPSWLALYPWAIAIAFGLLHGSAFAGALAEVGLPPDDIPVSLFLFNVGVEIGQLMFVGLVLAAMWVIAHTPISYPSWSRWVPAYSIGALAAFWFIERIQAVVA